MASNYVQLNWYEPSWDDDQVGALSSLERRQRKAAEKQDVLAFYSSLGFLFFIITGLLVWSEIYAFATAPSRALTGAFLLEVWRSAGVAYSQLQILYKHVGELAWIWNAVVYGHDFAQRGVSITHGAAKLLASGLYYYAVILSGLLMYWAYPYVVHAPVRTAALSTLAAGILFSGPPLYGLLATHLCHHCGPEPVVLLALLFVGLMLFAALFMSSSISGRPAGVAGSTASAAARQRSQAVRRPGGGCGTAAAGGGQPVNASSIGAAGVGGGAAAGGNRRNTLFAAAAGAANQTLSRLSSRGRSAGSAGGTCGGMAFATAGDGVHSAGGGGGSTRSASSSSLCGPASFPTAGFSCLATAATAAGGDPVGALSSSARSLSGLASGGSSSVDLGACCSPSKAGTLSAAGSNHRGGGQCSAGSSGSHDPVGMSSRTLEQRGGGAGGGGGSSSHAHSVSNSGGSGASIAKNSKQQQQQQQQQQQLISASGADNKGKWQVTSGRTASELTLGAATPGGGGGAIGGSAKHAEVTAAAPNKTSISDPVAAPFPGAHKKKGSTGSHAASFDTGVPPSAAAAAGGHSVATASSPGGGSGRHSAGHIPWSSATAVAGSSTPLANSNSLHAGVRARGDPTGAKVSNASGSSSGGAAKGIAAGVATISPASTAALNATQGSGTATVAAAAAPVAATTAAAAGGACGLLARLSATVTSAATVAPVLSGRGAKKVAATAAVRKPVSQQQPTQHSQPPQPQYVIVPPPPPPPRKPVAAMFETPSLSPQPAASPGASTAAMAGGSPTAAAGQPTAAAGQPVRNAWLNPNPVIKLAAGVAKGPKGAAAAAGAAAAGRSAVPLPTPAAAAGVAAAAGTRSTGGAPLGNTAQPLLAQARSASCGGGVALSDPWVSAGRCVRSPTSAVATGAACNDPVSPPPPIGSPTTAVGDPVSQTLGHGEGMPRLSQASSGGGGLQGSDNVVSATIVATESGMGPLVVHKHASGDLDIASAAANYLPYSSSTLTTAVVSTVQPNADLDSDSFSFFSFPPPAISDAGADPTTAPGTSDADSAQYTMSQALYGVNGGNHFAGLSSFAADPLWSPSVPMALFPSASPRVSPASAARAPRLPPPGFPSHAYGGAFASGPFPAPAWSQSHPSQPHPLTANTARDNAGGGADVPPLPPAIDSGVLASLGFVDDGADSNSGGGDDGAGSCAICWSRPRQVGFLHGKTSHLCVCRTCAAQLREGVHRCPMCRQLIERIIDIF